MKRILKVVACVFVFVAVCLASAVLFLYFRNGHVGTETNFRLSRFLGSATAPLSEPVLLKVATFNIQDLFIVGRDRPARMRHIAKTLADLDPDVVGFQESFIGKDRGILLKALEETRLRYHHYFSSGVGGSGLLISSVWPICEVFFHRFGVSGPPERVWEGDYWAGKGVALARIETPAGLVDFYNTHAQAGYGKADYRDVRQRQMAELASFVNGSRTGEAPAILVGDLNCGEGSVDFETARRDAGLTRLMNVESQIDHILAARNDFHAFETLDTVEITGTVFEGGRTFGLSDHPGFMSTIRVVPAGKGKE